MFQSFLAAGGSPANFIIRLAVGGVFFLEGIKKFLFAEQWGSGRFARIGIPLPGLMGPFVGIVETICGILLLLGVFTRLASLPLLIDISVAIATTKIPILVKSGFWIMEAEARTDFSMLMGFDLPLDCRRRASIGRLAHRAETTHLNDRHFPGRF